MKKLLISLLVFSFICFDVNGESYTIPLSYSVSPTYTIRVPKLVDVSNKQTTFDFSVSGDIYYDYVLEVKFDSSTTIASENNTNTISVTQDKTSFTYQEVKDISTSSVNLSHNELKSGTYRGQLNLSISLKEGA